MRFWPWPCKLPWPYLPGFLCFYHWCFWCVWILSHCCPVQILTSTLVHYLDPVLWVFDVFITDVFGVYESCHTVVQYRFWPWQLYITLTLSSGFFMFLSLMFLVCMNPVTLLSSTDSDLDTCTLPWPCPLGFWCFYHWCFWCVYESCHTVVQYRFWPWHLYITLTLSSGFFMFLSLMFLVCMNPVTLLSSLVLTPTADPGQLPASKWLHTCNYQYIEWLLATCLILTPIYYSWNKISFWNTMPWWQQSSNKMCLRNTNAPGGNKVQIGYLKYQDHKVTDPGVIWKGLLVKYACHIWNLFLLWFKSYGQGLFWLQTCKQTHIHTHTDRQEHSGSIPRNACVACAT